MSDELVKGVDKVTRYGWTVIDEPGEFSMVAKGSLHVDSEYQRNVTDAKVLEIAAAWSWVACGVIGVGRRDGKLWVFDGQHRLAAAMKRSDIKELPCFVYRTNDQAKEAGAFLIRNTFGKPVSALDKFKAKVKAGDGNAIFVKQVLEEHSLEIGSNTSVPSTIKCVDLCQRLAQADRDNFRKLIAFVAKLCADSMGVNDRILNGIAYIHKNCGEGLDDPKLASRLLEVGPGALLEGASRAAAYYAKGGPKVYAQGFLDITNKYLRNKYELITAIPEMRKEGVR